MSRRVYWLLVPLAVVAACGGSDAAPTGPGNGGGSNPPPTPVPEATIRVQNDVFSPEVAAVTRGGTVTWVWDGSNHSVVSVLSPAFSPGNSGIHNAPFTFGPVTFTTAGTYRFICSVHGSSSGTSVGGMAGSVVVQ
jgi:plastocyanin